MSKIQLAIRIPQSLQEKLDSYINRTGISKTEIVIGALSHYLGCVENLSLIQRVNELEAKVSILESQINLNRN